MYATIWTQEDYASGPANISPPSILEALASERLGCWYLTGMWSFLTDLECVLFASIVEEARLLTDHGFMGLEDLALTGEGEIGEFVGVQQPR